MWSEVRFRVRNAFIWIELVQLDIHPEQIPAFTRNDQDIAFLRGLDQALAPQIREIGVCQNVHHAPGLMRGVAVQLASDGFAHCAARAVTSHYIIRTQSDCVTCAAVLGHMLQRYGDGMIISANVDGQIPDAKPVEWFKTGRGIFHYI